MLVLINSSCVSMQYLIDCQGRLISFLYSLGGFFSVWLGLLSLYCCEQLALSLAANVNHGIWLLESELTDFL